MEIYLVRHTTPKIEKGICYGQTDLEIDETHWHDEFKTIQQKLPSDPDEIFSSPLNRCKVLAEQLGSTVHYDDRLKEMNFGDWENKKWDEIPLNELQPWMDDFVDSPTKNGENFFKLHERTTHFIEDLLEIKIEKTIIITHAGNIRSFISYILDLPLENAFRIHLNYGYIVHLRIDKNKSLGKLISIS